MSKGLNYLETRMLQIPRPHYLAWQWASLSRARHLSSLCMNPSRIGWIEKLKFFLYRRFVWWPQRLYRSNLCLPWWHHHQRLWDQTFLWIACMDWTALSTFSPFQLLQPRCLWCFAPKCSMFLSQYRPSTKSQSHQFRRVYTWQLKESSANRFTRSQSFLYILL